MKEEKTIVEAMTTFNKQNIILFSGLFGTHKTSLGKFIAKLYKFEFVNLAKFFYPMEVFDKEENYVKLSDGSKVLPWDDIYKSVDWDKFNKKMNDVAPHGVVAVGIGFPASKIKFKPDFHIHLKVSKEKVMENISLFVKTHQYKIEHTPEINTLIFNRITFPIYIRARNESPNITRYVNVTDLTFGKLKDDIHPYLLRIIDKWLKDHDKNNDNDMSD